MPALAITILQFVDEHQPGFVECLLVDAHGANHVFIEKVPVVSQDDLWSDSAYPQSGSIECVIHERWQDALGRALVRATTEYPWHVESMAGEFTFVVLASQVLRREHDV